MTFDEFISSELYIEPMSFARAVFSYAMSGRYYASTGNNAPRHFFERVITTMFKEFKPQSMNEEYTRMLIDACAFNSKLSDNFVFQYVSELRRRCATENSTGSDLLVYCVILDALTKPSRVIIRDQILAEELRLFELRIGMYCSPIRTLDELCVTDSISLRRLLRRVTERVSSYCKRPKTTKAWIDNDVGDASVIARRALDRVIKHSMDYN